MRFLGSCVFLAACTGCGGQPSVTGTVLVDNVPFQATTCFAGSTSGFFGAELVSTSGARLRLVYDPKGTAHVYLFDQQAEAVGLDFGECGEMMLFNMHLAHGHGTAALSCAANGRTVKAADLAFRDCEFVR